MITEWLATTGAAIGAWFASLFEPLELPEWAIDGADGIYEFLDSASGLGHWFAWETLSVVVGGLVVVFGVTFGAKLLREIAKHIPFVGGGG